MKKSSTLFTPTGLCGTKKECPKSGPKASTLVKLRMFARAACITPSLSGLPPVVLN
ncbi:MAG: hypothetical protein K2I69_09890 [Muribaculaceae bacterium]|nr:hypothetical protein [Muribaculaceae bacterium]MDE6574642.1 hypothetical protein [Muribaculaceae bacterium]